MTALYLKLLACERLHIPPVAGTFDDQPSGVQAVLIQYARMRERLEAR